MREPHALRSDVPSPVESVESPEASIVSISGGDALWLVVVTHRSGRSLPGLLSSLRAHEPSVAGVVVDNASPGGPPEVRDDLEVLGLTRNLGFGTACNRGVAAADDRSWGVVGFLNPDVRLQGPSLTELYGRLRSRPEIGIATGPLVDARGTRIPAAWGPTSALRAFWFASGWRLPRLRRTLGSGLRRAVTSEASRTDGDLPVDGHVLGGAMLVRRECWEELGGFDEDFFLYWEDADLCQRARRAGWEVWQLDCTPIVHEAGTSSEGVSDEQRWRWYVEGADRFARKHLTPRGHRRLMAALRWGRRLRGWTGR